MKIRTIWILLLISTTAVAQIAFRRMDYPVAADKIDAADFNRDGYMDVIVSHWQGVTILFGAEGAILSQRIDIPIGAGTLDVVTADFNGDGNPDFAVITRFFWGAGSKV